MGKRPVRGCEVDDFCRSRIEAAGYKDHFTHRTGHSITTSVHGSGPNLDNFESEDRRELQKGHLFSVEPGIYLDDCGFRTEIDCLAGADRLEVTTLPLQMEITPLF
jgi:Xaa-Pro aminopeptidase